MTNEEFDKRLSEHINQVFDDTQHAGADEGWLLLREKYPVKTDKKPIAWFWWGAAAALLLFGIAAGLWLNNNKLVVQNQLSSIKRIPAKANNDSALQRIDKPAGAKIPVPDKTPPVLNHTAASTGTGVNKPLPVIALNKTSRKQITRAIAKNVFTGNVKPANTAFAGKNTSAASQNTEQANDQHNTAVDSMQTAVKTLTAKTTDTTSAKQTGKPVIASTKPVKRDSTKRIAKTPGNKKVVFGVFASAFNNYASNSNRLSDLGGGATVDIRLYGNLKLATGIGVIRNSLYYTQPPGSGSAAVSTTATSTIGITTQTTAFKDYQANLLALDLPVNVKYQFGSSHSFISAGFSSQSYIRQKYTQVNSYTTYTTSSTSLSVANSIDVPTTQNYGFSHLDLFKTLDLSFGLGYRISSKSELVFEPFLKAPLSGLGSQNLKYGSYGLNLKLSFERKP